MRKEKLRKQKKRKENGRMKVEGGEGRIKNETIAGLLIESSWYPGIHSVVRIRLLDMMG